MEAVGGDPPVKSSASIFGDIANLFYSSIETSVVPAALSSWLRAVFASERGKAIEPRSFPFL